ncbi:MAG: flavin reductase family protein [Bacteroidetes bacterium]|nr:flavin reductase family protein [Bacteroidota bacterium]
MLRIDPQEVSIPKLHGYMLGAIAPRPIAFASTIDKDGKPNLAPFSFFNAFGSNPTTLIFSPSRRVKDNTIKHTLENVREVPEVVINVVSFNMVQQTSLASTEYEKGVNEFTKAGFTELQSEMVKPLRIKESPVHFECKVREVIETGQEGGAGNLIVCEILLMHISDDILDEDGRIDQHKIDLVGRLGKNHYVRASGSAIFNVEKPVTTMGIGVDQLPEHIRLSNVLTGNDLGMLGNVESIPGENDVNAIKDDDRVKQSIENNDMEALHMYGKELLEQGEVEKAWQVLLSLS